MKTNVFARGRIKNPVAAEDHRMALSWRGKDTVRLTFAPRPEPGAPELICLDNKATDTKGQYRKTRGEAPGPDKEYQSKIRILCHDGKEYAVVFVGRKHGDGAGDDDTEVFVTTPPPGGDDR